MPDLRVCGRLSAWGRIVESFLLRPTTFADATGQAGVGSSELGKVSDYRCPRRQHPNPSEDDSQRPIIMASFRRRMDCPASLQDGMYSVRVLPQPCGSANKAFIHRTGGEGRATAWKTVQIYIHVHAVWNPLSRGLSRDQRHHTSQEV